MTLIYQENINEFLVSNAFLYYKKYIYEFMFYGAEND